MIRYYVWENDNRISDGFEDFKDALKFAMENNGTEIEKTIWNSEEAYQNYEPADDFEIVWSK